jgi:sugar phosphate isomerase/epimerase
VRLACADDTFRLLEHEHILELIALLGLDGVDLCLMKDRSPVRPEQVRGDIPGWARRLDERVRSRGLAVADLFVIPWTDFERLAPNHPDRREREEAAALFRDMLELAVGVGAPGMTMLPGVDWPGESHEESLQRSSQELAWRAEEARAAGVRFSIEPHLGSVAQSPSDAGRLCGETPGLELTLDYSHFVYQGYPQAEIEPLVRHARHFHARAARERRMQVSLKENVIDFERVIDVMGETGYDGYLGLEYVWLEWEHCNKCDNVSETVLLRDRLRAKLAGVPWTYPEGLV